MKHKVANFKAVFILLCFGAGGASAGSDGSEVLPEQGPIISSSNTQSSDAQNENSEGHRTTEQALFIETDTKLDSRCKREAESEEWLDRMRAGTHSRMCYGASWLDGLFGDDERFQGENFSGKVSLGFKEDEVEGLDPRLRVRIRAKLPNVSNRFDAFLGRVEEDSFISNTEVAQDRLTNVGLRSTNDEDSEWLVGLGYRRPTKDHNGFDFSVGAKLSSGFSPYAKVAHRYLFQTRDDRYTRSTQTVFWRENEGYGVSSNLEYTRFIGRQNIAVLQGSVKYTEELSQWEWFTDATWHHSITDKRGISGSVYARGLEDSAVTVPEFGTTLTYVRPVLREWLYMELGVDFRWEREDFQTEYKSAARVGIQFEMLLGDYYRKRRHK